MGTEFAALLGLAGLSGAFALLGLVAAAWMAWRIVAKAGLPGWVGMIAVLLTLTAVGSIVPLILLWVFAFMHWPRDEAPVALGGPAAPPAQPMPPGTLPATPIPPAVLPPPAAALSDRRGWTFTGKLAGGAPVALRVDDSATSWLLTGASAAQPTDLSLPDPSVGQPHARVMVAGNRLGLLDLGHGTGTYIDGARLLPEHGPRDITSARSIRVGSVELGVTRS